GADTRFVFTAPASGQYVLEMRDNRYKPGGRYRLRLGDFFDTLVSTPLPLLAQRATPAPIRFLGPQAAGPQTPTVSPVGGTGQETIGLSAKAPGRQSSGWTSLGITDLPICREDSAAAGGAEKASIKIPCVISGTLLTAGERDLFSFQATKGTQV